MLRLFLSLAVVLFLWSPTASAATLAFGEALANTCITCPTGDKTLTTQTEVDDFGIDFPNCRRIDGRLIIDGSSITDLTPLAGIEEVAVDLLVTRFSGQTFAGLHNLVSVGRDVRIFQNAPTSLAGLEGLTSVGRILNIGASTTLESLDGLDSLHQVLLWVFVHDNSGLTDISGLSQIAMPELMTIRDNTSLSECAIESVCNRFWNFDLDSEGIQVSGNAAGTNGAFGCENEIAVINACNATPILPVMLSSFTGFVLGKAAQLDWTTDSESGNDFFSIERSSNARDWSEIGQVAGNGTTAERSSYRFIDRNPVNGRNHYRLRQVDSDGSFAYSDVVIVEFAAAAEITLFPNPASTQLNLRGVSEGSEISIFNSAGQQVLRTLSADANDPIFVGNLPAGFYAVRVVKDGNIQTLRFTKQ